jgi:hypothetical protein
MVRVVSTGVPSEGYVPVYLEDRTLIGKAKISNDGKHIEIDIPGDSPVAELMAEGLIGLSTWSMAAGTPVGAFKEEVTNNKGEN